MRLHEHLVEPVDLTSQLVDCVTLLLGELVHHHQLFSFFAVEMVLHHLDLCLEIVILSLLDLE